ncbi:hypothetical protein MauCBS54593_005980 [Microsporum audouinii]
MSATASAPAGCVRHGHRDCDSSGTLVSQQPQSPSPQPSSFLPLNINPFSCSSTSLTPQIGDSSSFSPSDHFATFLPDTYLTQDQYLLSSTASDIPGVEQSVTCWDLYDDPLQALLSTEDFAFINAGNQLLIPSVDNSPAHTPTSKEDSLRSMKDCDHYHLDAPLVGHVDNALAEASEFAATNSSHSSPTRPGPLSATVPDIGRSPESFSSSTTKSIGSRKRQRADDVKRSEEEIANEKRQRNTMAARRFRKRKEDRISNLEKQLADALRERDELKLQVARLEGQNMMLRKCQ